MMRKLTSKVCGRHFKVMERLLHMHFL
uniref:Uncharacterized protein n=1 Tax=Anguilla anguilla TaxID=7936 RepID=A0A0E9RMG5_ANGAN